eukprot:CAMPEP_0172456338 /NCGR_PEP_ID=MMETSP1065-20121228/15208_1 /TAXON_ID=265537 /ORGANISM="Amphiprora paludosa, Strain CCMP125" /LENGTH=45 /DNA_ID= /DNA_START= /DNA_END= /DNA_ORIENTATION=
MADTKSRFATSDPIAEFDVTHTVSKERNSKAAMAKVDCFIRVTMM